MAYLIAMKMSEEVKSKTSSIAMARNSGMHLVGDDVNTKPSFLILATAG